MKQENKFLSDLFIELNKLDIKYCVLRNYEGLPNSLNGSDLDILVSQKDLKSFYIILYKILRLNNGNIIVKYGKLTPRICVTGINSSGCYGVQFDVHENILPYKTNNMFPVEFLLERSNLYNDILVANDDDANIIAFFKEIFNNGICKKQYFNNFKLSWTKNKDLYKKMLFSIYNENFLVALDELSMKEYNENEIYKLSKYGQRILEKGLIVKLNNFTSKISRFYRFFNPPGFTIAILGTDGAGKTTIIDAISEPLNEAVHNALYYEHMRPNLIPNIAQLFGKQKQSGSVVNPHEAKPSGFLGSLLRLFYYSFDYIFGFWFKVYPIIVKKSSIWIFDRYYYDYLIDQKRAKMNLPKWIIKGMGIVIPKPNLIICLGTEAEIIHKRKPELPLEEIEYQVNILKTFCNNEQKAIWVDTGTSLDKSIETTFNIIKNKMADRYNERY